MFTWMIPLVVLPSVVGIHELVGDDDAVIVIGGCALRFSDEATGERGEVDQFDGCFGEDAPGGRQHDRHAE